MNISFRIHHTKNALYIKAAGKADQRLGCCSFFFGYPHHAACYPNRRWKVAERRRPVRLEPGDSDKAVVPKL